MSLVSLSRPVLALWVVVACLLASSPQASEERALKLRYHVEIGPIAEGSGPVHVFLPIAQDDEHQSVTATIESDVKGTERTERKYGNRYWHGVIENPTDEVVEITVDYDIVRRPFRRELLEGSRTRMTRKERKMARSFLKPNELVPVGVDILSPMLQEIHSQAGTREKGRVARAIYDWLVDNMEYKKVGTGWGNGDTYWACSERYGNCTDFHSLFNSLARTEGIPARFEIGFPIPTDRTEGKIGGYHCWTQFYLPAAGWVPIDASEAFKHPEKREHFYGGQATDRVRFSTGRDLELGSGHRSAPLNYFIYPHVEVGGEAYEGEVVLTVTYEDQPEMASGPSGVGQ